MANKSSEPSLAFAVAGTLSIVARPDKMAAGNPSRETPAAWSAAAVQGGHRVPWTRRRVRSATSPGPSSTDRNIGLQFRGASTPAKRRTWKCSCTTMRSASRRRSVNRGTSARLCFDGPTIRSQETPAR